MPVFQRFRSGDRDQATDAARLAGVRTAIEAAIAEAERERDGLRRRAETAGSNAAFLIEGDTESRGEGEGDRRISAAEETMRQAERRLSDLDHQLAGLRGLLAGLQAIGLG